MELILNRTYHTTGTNGRLYCNGQEICKTIELAWRKNALRRSCIPEGKYRLSKRYSSKHGWHFEIMNVPNRSCILIHTANNAGRELLGCIAPVAQHIGEGKGNSSRIAMQRLRDLLFPLLDRGISVQLIITTAL